MALLFAAITYPAAARAVERDRPLGPLVTEQYDLDAHGCLLAPATVPDELRGRDRLALAEHGIVPSGPAQTDCGSEQQTGATWRFGRAWVSGRSGRTPAGSVDVAVDLVDLTLAEDWLLAGVGDRELRVIAGVDQCTPQGRWSVRETASEVRVRYARPTAVTNCGLVGIFWWASEKKLPLDAPLGDRKVVLEFPAPDKYWYSGDCHYNQRALSAMENTASERIRVRIAEEGGNGAVAPEFHRRMLLVDGLTVPDRAERQRIAAGIRADLARDRYPGTCERQPEYPAVTSAKPTRFVAAGEFGDAYRIGLDAGGDVTWIDRKSSGDLIRCQRSGALRAVDFDLAPGGTYFQSGTVTYRPFDPRTGTYGRRKLLAKLRNVNIRESRVTCDERGGMSLMTEGEYEAGEAGPKYDAWYAANGRSWHRVDTRLCRGGLGASTFVGVVVKDLAADDQVGSLLRIDLRTGRRATGGVGRCNSDQLVAPDGRHFASDGHASISLFRLVPTIRRVMAARVAPSFDLNEMGASYWLDEHRLVRWQQVGGRYRLWTLLTSGAMRDTGITASRRVHGLVEDPRSRVLYGVDQTSSTRTTTLVRYDRTSRSWKPFGGKLATSISGVVPVA